MSVEGQSRRSDRASITSGLPRTLRGYANAWLKPIFRSYDTVAVNAL
jgi:hypothetical protein